MKLRSFIFIISTFSSLIYANETSFSMYEQGTPLTPYQINAGYNSPARINIESGINSYAALSFLWWEPLEHGLELGYTTNDIYVKEHDIKFKFKPGFKANLGFHVPYDGWNFDLNYTFYENSFKSSKISTENLTQYWYKSDLTKLTSLQSKLKIEFNMLDAVFCRPFYSGTKLIVKPFAGAKGGWIDQHYDVRGFTYFLKNDYNSTKSSSWLLGGTMGLKTSWFLLNNLNLFINGSASLFYQEYKVKNYQKTIEKLLIVDYLAAEQKIKNITPNFDISLGFNLGSYMLNNKIHMDFSVGYDLVVYFNQNAISYTTQGLLNSTPGSSFNNLMFHGLSGSLRVDF